MGALDGGERGACLVGRDAFVVAGADVCAVETVFIGVERSDEDGRPVLFETRSYMIDFDWDQQTVHERYATWAAAAKGHAKWFAAQMDGVQSAHDQWVATMTARRGDTSSP